MTRNYNFARDFNGSCCYILTFNLFMDQSILKRYSWGCGLVLEVSKSNLMKVNYLGNLEVIFQEKDWLIKVVSCVGMCYSCIKMLALCLILILSSCICIIQA